uniref:Uncharacterized protein n=1 Tax=Amphimedon queenslandica TaxID=400682 RepID=A0A1X7TNG8_AMPQE
MPEPQCYENSGEFYLHSDLADVFRINLFLIDKLSQSFMTNDDKRYLNECKYQSLLACFRKQRE